MKHVLAQWVAWPVVVGMVFATGCGFLDTRDPLQPPDKSCLAPLAQTAPENILANYENAVGCKIQGVNQFQGTMNAETFLFTLDSVDAIELMLPFISRDQTVESFRRGATDAGSDSLGFTFGDKPPEQSANEAFYDKVPYTFQVVDADSLKVLETYSGTADIRLHTNEFGQWEIVSWNDFNDGSGHPTWGRWLGSRVSAPGSRGRLD